MVVVTFTSNPPGAVVSIDPWNRGDFNHHYGVTPFSMSMGGGVSWQVKFEKLGYDSVIVQYPDWSDGAVNHADLTPTYEPLQPTTVGGFEDSTVDPRVPGFHVQTPIDNRMPVYLDATVWGAPAWYATRPESDPECPEWDNCVIYKYVPPPGYDILNHTRGGIAVGELPFCPGEICSYPRSRVVLKKTGLNCVEDAVTCAGEGYEDKYRCSSNNWGVEQYNSPDCMAGAGFNVVIDSVVATPPTIDLGGDITFKVTMTNTGNFEAPAGLVVEVLVNGVLLLESTPCPPIPAGQTVTGTVHIIASATGALNICARVKAGYYDTPPQLTCDLVEVAQPPDCTEDTYRCLGYTRQKCVGGQWIDYEQNSPDCGYPTPECTDGETRCDGTTLQHCYNGTWVDIEENSPSCTEPEPGGWLDYLKEHAVGIGLLSIAAIGGLGIMMTQKKKY